MSSIRPILIFFGAGARVGAATTAAFVSKGYLVARVSRSAKSSEDTSTLLNIAADLSQADAVESVFTTVRQKWGEPSVVIYNAYGSNSTDMNKPLNTFNLSTADFAKSQAVNITSSFVAMREALASFQSPAVPSGPKTFIFTGNALNQGPFPGFLTLGSGKAGAAWMVECADSIFSASSKYGTPEEKGGDVRFFYVDERHEDGTPLFTGLGAQGHADAFSGLVGRKEGWKGLGWLVTFVSGDEKEGRETRFKEFRRGLILPEGM